MTQENQINTIYDLLYTIAILNKERRERKEYTNISDQELYCRYILELNLKVISYYERCFEYRPEHELTRSYLFIGAIQSAIELCEYGTAMRMIGLALEGPYISEEARNIILTAKSYIENIAERSCKQAHTDIEKYRNGEPLSNCYITKEKDNKVYEYKNTKEKIKYEKDYKKI